MSVLDAFTGTGGTSGKIFGEAGNDTLKGGFHADVLVGGLDKDTLTGGGGGDKFVFNGVVESAVGADRDVITDFNHSQHDKINLHDIDANTTIGDNQAFHFIGSHGFHHNAGELRFAHHVLSGDVNGDGVADFQISIHVSSLSKADLIL